MLGAVWLSAAHCFVVCAFGDRRGMKPPEEPGPGKVERPKKLSRSEEARRIIQEYVDNPREIIGKLRRA